MVWLLPVVPLLAAAAAIGLRRRPLMAVSITLAAVAATLVLAVWAAVAEPAGVLRWSTDLGLTARAAGFGRVMVVLVPLVALPVIGYAAATERAGRVRLLALLTGFVGAMELLVVAGDLLTLLVAWELIGASSWALIGHAWRDPTTGRAATQAFVTTRIGDLGLYVAAGATFAGAGSFDLAAIGELQDGFATVVAGGVLLAAAAKSAQLPFAPWLFSAMAGPTPASALLHSATLVSAGAFLLIRVSPQLAPVGWFLPAVTVVGLTTALAGSLVALAQDHAKRVLAGSTSAQYGLMFLAVGAGSVAAGGAQLVAHALFKSLLFLAAGVAIHAAGSADLGRMQLGRSLPRSAALAGIGALALAAIPPLGGAWSKEQIVVAAAERSAWLGGATLLVAVLTAGYATRFWLLTFGSGTSAAPGRVPAARPGRVEVAALALLAAASVLLGSLWLPGGGQIVESLAGGTLAHGGAVGMLAAVAAVALGSLGMAVLHRSGRSLDLGVPVGARRVVANWFGLPALARVLVVDPVLGSSRALASLDARVVDAGVRGAARLAAACSQLLARVGEPGFTAAAHGIAATALGTARLLRHGIERAIDGAVTGVAAGTDWLAAASHGTDDRGIDAAVEQLGQVTGAVGRRAQATQTGLSHRYYLYVTVGTALLIVVLAALR